MKILQQSNQTYIISILGVLIIVCLCVGSFYSLKNEYELNEKNAYQDMNNYSSLVRENTEKTISSADRLLLFLKFQYEHDKNNFDINKYATDGIIDTRGYNQVGVIDSNGIYIISNLNQFEKVDLSDREHFFWHKDKNNNELFISKAILGRASRKYSYALTG